MLTCRVDPRPPGRWLACQVLLKIAYLLMRWSFNVTVLVFRGDEARDAEILMLRHENAAAAPVPLKQPSHRV
jgi:hypothetical protein